MNSLPKNFYSDWWQRLEQQQAFLNDGDDHSFPPEKLLQSIWYHQRICRDQLNTTDGRRVTVIHPGFWNHEAGPDFREAIVRYGDDEPLCGDVEIDVVPENWYSHGHANNPNFENVVLHVVWETGRSQTNSRTLELSKFLDAPLDDIQSWSASDASSMQPDWISGKCSAPLSQLKTDVVLELLEQAAICRMKSKAQAFEIRAKTVGWKQAFWEGLFTALGYKQNSWPMRHLAELLPRMELGEFDLQTTQAVLLGIAGLLPSEISGYRNTTDIFVRDTWDHWWRLRERYEKLILPKAAWKFNSLRPANHPQRRLALAAHWLHNGEFISALEKWITAPVNDQNLTVSLLGIIQIDSDPFWSRHWTLHGKTLSKTQPLLGVQRLTDIVVNVILPWFWGRANVGDNHVLKKEVEHRLLRWPRGEENSRTRMARSRLFGNPRSPRIRTVAHQQGLLQIESDFCNNSNAICEDCRFPELVEQLQVF